MGMRLRQNCVGMRLHVAYYSMNQVNFTFLKSGFMIIYVVYVLKVVFDFHRSPMQGLGVKSTLRHICFHTVNRQLRDFLVSQGLYWVFLHGGPAHEP